MVLTTSPQARASTGSCSATLTLTLTLTLARTLTLAVALTLTLTRRAVQPDHVVQELDLPPHPRLGLGLTPPTASPKVRVRVDPTYRLTQG